MKKRDGLYAFVLLFISVCALTIGFAAYTRSLDILYTSAEVRPSNSLNVHFPFSGSITPTSGSETSYGDTVVLNSGTVISNLKAYFTAPGDYIIYNTVIYNDSAYDAYLKAVDFSYDEPICTPFTDSINPNPASEGNLNAICNNLKVYVTIEDLISNISSDAVGLSNIKIPANSYVPVSIKITFEGDLNGDGDFTAFLGDIDFHFSSVD